MQNYILKPTLLYRPFSATAFYILFETAFIPFLAHLWGAYAIPLALSVVRRLSSVVSSVSTITTRNN